jgi:hypothetical protein
MKRVSVILSLLTALVFTMTAISAAKDVTEFAGGPMGKVIFDHKKHQEKLGDCKSCHHKDEVGKETVCSGCHSKNTQVNAKTAYHNSCIKCHKEKNQGPKGCKDCHKK